MCACYINYKLFLSNLIQITELITVMNNHRTLLFHCTSSEPIFILKIPLAHRITQIGQQHQIQFSKVLTDCCAVA